MFVYQASNRTRSIPVHVLVWKLPVIKLLTQMGFILETDSTRLTSAHVPGDPAGSAHTAVTPEDPPFRTLLHSRGQSLVPPSHGTDPTEVCQW